MSESSETLAFGLALLRQDLNAALPRTFVPPNGGTEPALLSGASGFSLSVGGLAPLRQDVTSFGRAVWRFERGTGNVYRSVWTTRTPGGGRPTDVLVFDGITAFDLASFTVTAGWQPGFAVDPRNPSVLPLGLRVRMEHERYAMLETLVSLR
ncbi:MAG: type II secretion system protein GspJ [Pseudomonadota bacterium]